MIVYICSGLNELGILNMMGLEHSFKFELTWRE